MTAANVPSGLKYQLLTPLNSQVCSELYNRIFSVISGTMGPGSVHDRDGVTEALNTSGLLISQNILEDEQQSEIWFTSKWAMKIVNKMASKTGLKMDLNRKESSVGPLSFPNNNNDNNKNNDNENDKNNNKNFIDLFDENPLLICSLCNLWSIILPHATFSASIDSTIAKSVKKNNNEINKSINFVDDNKSWKALSFLSFGTFAAERLWVAIDKIYFDEKNKIMTINKNINKLQLKLNKSEMVNEIDKEKQSNIKISKIDDKNEKDHIKKSGSTMSNFLNLFSFSTNSTTSNNAGINANENNKKLENNYSNSNQNCDIEEFGLKIFSPQYHLQPECSDSRFAILVTFATILKTILTTTDDYEFYNVQKPFPLVQYVRMIRTFKIILYRILRYDPSLAVGSLGTSAEETEKLYSYGCVRSISGVLSDLYLRWARKPFSPSNIWVLDDVLTAHIKEEFRTCSPFAGAILREMPWCINFYERMKIFREVIDTEKLSIQGNDPQNPRRSGVIVNVRRSHVLLDGMQAFEKVGNGIKDKIVVKYIDAFGQQESGMAVQYELSLYCCILKNLTFTCSFIFIFLLFIL